MPRRTSHSPDPGPFTWHRLGQLVGHAVRFRCPNCGSRPARVSWLTRLPGCPTCGLRFDRGEHDHFIGAYLPTLIAAERLPAIELPHR